MLVIDAVGQEGLEQVRIGVVADGVAEHGRDPGARIVAPGTAIARLRDPFYP